MNDAPKLLNLLSAAKVFYLECLQCPIPQLNVDVLGHMFCELVLTAFSEVGAGFVFQIFGDGAVDSRLSTALSGFAENSGQHVVEDANDHSALPSERGRNIARVSTTDNNVAILASEELGERPSEMEVGQFRSGVSQERAEEFIGLHIIKVDLSPEVRVAPDHNNTRAVGELREQQVRQERMAQVH